MVASILQKIKDYKVKEIESLKTIHSLKNWEEKALKAQPPIGFLKKLKEKKLPTFNIIAEIKKASPSKGIIRKNFDPASIAMTYDEAGATCISVLTDGPSFQGKPEDLKIVRRNSTLPILRKEFIFDEIQVFESRYLGADCILIIMAAVSDSEAIAIEKVALDLDMDIIIEVHNRIELDRALQLKSKLIGINNRDLNTFKTDLNTTKSLNKFIPNEYHVISESGLLNREDLEIVAKNNINSFLIGETFMRSENIKNDFKKLLGNHL